MNVWSASAMWKSISLACLPWTGSVSQEIFCVADDALHELAQEAGLVAGGVHRKRRDPRPLPGDAVAYSTQPESSGFGMNAGKN